MPDDIGRGVLRFYDDESETGFIISDDGREAFVESSALTEELVVGDRVRYRLNKDKQGLTAVDVQKLAVHPDAVRGTPRRTPQRASSRPSPATTP